MPLTNKPKKLTVLIQWVMRTTGECRGESTRSEIRDRSPGRYADSAVAMRGWYHENAAKVRVPLSGDIVRMLSVSNGSVSLAEQCDMLESRMADEDVGRGSGDPPYLAFWKAGVLVQFCASRRTDTVESFRIERSHESCFPGWSDCTRGCHCGGAGSGQDQSERL